ncbi:MAG: histidine phosphatase family protein [Actinomycetota bacterium]|nr:histidine phosphatase family protein [Actinomycetota bacterium]
MSSPVEGEGTELWLVRHGETEWSRGGRHTSVTDLELTAEGEAAGRRLAERLRPQSFGLVFTRPMRRAVRTAQLAGFPEAQHEPALVEWGYGEYEGLTTVEIRERVPGWTVWTHPCPGGESAERVGARASRVVATIRNSGVDRALVFAHGHFGRVLAARWLGLSVSDGIRFRLDTATVSALGWDKEHPALVSWNT